MIDRFLDRLAALVEPTILALVIILLAWIVLRLTRATIQRAVARALQSERLSAREEAARVRTLTTLAESAVRLTVILLALLTILSIYGVPIGPLLASAGVVGLALGLGAQTLIRDVIAGIFIVLEDQYHVGDVIHVNNVSGSVEALTLRYTALRTLEGAYVIVPNGEIRIVQNLSRDWARAIIDVPLVPEEDVDRIIDILRPLLAALPSDPELGPLVLEPGEVFGVESIGQQQATIRIAVKTRPREQWRVARELRRRILYALREAGISAPYPRTVMIFHPSSPQPPASS
ncbi:mechanosensitive ion channel family protein [Thermomicrobium sp. 4228-Ro]|uniref:mechanosensitive ion channel family protein n=1 Tax=Thermomicrobium sp. 4228-Ro TaxID=2993937 RepID=UPI002248B929|nr:mechanosensitive ion channel family protein [Thermomicrobium sp. 4228-Ro]MCX2727164.1 mechanosensitive ion channel family protein [Thermomicrobium sp. 4228-Ro]